MELENRLKISKLIDTYGSLLTKKQNEQLKLYFFNNLSLGEIAENNGVTRQAVKDIIDRSVQALNNYENKLKLIQKKEKITNYINKFSIKEKQMMEKILELLEE